MKAGGWIAIAVIVLVVLIGGGSYVSTKNTLVQKNEDVNQQFHQLDVVQQRRLDLIPNLVASVKGYVKEEETVLTNIANARAGVLASASGTPTEANAQANSKLSAAIVPLFRLQEAYPNLKSDAQFKRLMDELAGTENRIAVERQKYNKTLEDYDVYVRQFPNSLWAGMAGFHYRNEYYQGDPSNAKAPTVDFSK